MAINRGDLPLRSSAKVRGIKPDRPVPLRAFNPIKSIRDRNKPFHYVVQIHTRDRRSGEDIYRTITVTESQRGRLDGILDDATDAIMESPVAGREDFVSSRLISAQRFAG